MLKTLMATAGAATLLFMSSLSFAQDAGVDAGPDGGADAGVDAGADAGQDTGGTPDLMTGDVPAPDQGGGGGGPGIQDCLDDSDCDEVLAEQGLDDPDLRFFCNDDGVCEIQVMQVGECEDDTDCCPRGTEDCTEMFQCEASVGECREVDDRGVACMDDSDCPRGEPCGGDGFCEPQGVACGRTDGCSELGRGGGCNVAGDGTSPLASTGLVLLSLLGIGVLFRRRVSTRR